MPLALLPLLFFSLILRIVISVDPEVNTLQANQVIIGYVASKGYTYYEIDNNPAGGKDLTISVTGLSGDPDLYMALMQDIAFPTTSRFQWRASHLGGDALLIPSEDSKNCYHQQGNSALCKYRLAVYGYMESTYTLVARWNSSEPLPLVLGRPQDDEVEANTYRQYSFPITPQVLAAPAGSTSAVLQVLLNAKNGDPDLYLTLEGTRPDSSHYQYKSSDWGSSQDRIVIHANDQAMQDFCPHQLCTLRIGVFGFHQASFSLTLSTYMEAILLQEGMPLHGTLPSQTYQRYSTVWPSTTLDDDVVIITLTPQSGHPLLYASCRTDFPNATNHDWTLDPRTDKTLEINSMAAASKGCLAAKPLGLSVMSASSSTTFNLLVSKHSTVSAPTLINGVPIYGQARRNTFQYYQIRLGQEYVDVDVMLVVQSGEVDLYVSNSFEERPRYDAEHDTVSSYTLKSSREGDDRISIKHSHFEACSAEKEDGCYYIVGVLGRQYNVSEFSIVTRKVDSTISLGDGLAVRDYVGPHNYQYFKINVVEKNVDVGIFLTTFTGDADLYVAMAPLTHPTKENHTWVSRSFGTDSLTIQADSMKDYCLPDPAVGLTCDVYVGVYGWSNSSFSVMSSLNRGWDNPIPLTAGQPQNGHVETGSYVYYVYYVPLDAENVRFVLTPSSSEAESDQDLYLSTDADTQPGKDHFDLRSTAWASVDEIDFDEDDGAEGYFCSDCMVYLAVYGYTEGEYTLLVENGMTILQDAEAVTGHVTSGSISYYKLYNGDPEAHVIFSLTSFAGDADMFVIAAPYDENIDDDDDEEEEEEEEGDQGKSKKSKKLPSRDNYQWKGNRVGDDVVEILPSDANFCYDCDYIVGVQGWSNSSFLLTGMAEELAVIPLRGARPQTSSVSQSSMKYFSVTLENTAEDLTVTLTILSGSCQLYVADNLDVDHLPHIEDPSSYKYTSRIWFRPEVTIPGPHTNRTTFVIGVYGLHESVFSILASFSQMPILLQEGVPLQHAVSAGKNEYFLYRINSYEDITISVTALSGDPDILASTVHERPLCIKPEGQDEWMFHCHNYTWISQSYSSSELTILQDLPCEEVGETRVAPDCQASMVAPGNLLYISVYGYSGDTSFTISLTTGGHPTNLMAGNPQHGRTRIGTICEHRNEDTGACEEAPAPIKAQILYYKFMLSYRANGQADNSDMAPHLSIMLESICNTTAGRGSVSGCPIGCPCNPLTLYINSCEESKCTTNHQYPSPYHSQIQYVAKETFSTLLIEHDPSNPSNGYCNPQDKGQNCFYFIAVYHEDIREAPASFSIMAATPADVTILPTRMRPPPPDGSIVTSSDSVETDMGQAGKKYQMYAPKGGSYFLSMEVCTGDVNLAVCDATCTNGYPTQSEYTYFADSAKTCSKAGGCLVVTNKTPQILLNHLDEASYFLMVNGSGKYFLKIISADPQSQRSIAPFLAPPAGGGEHLHLQDIHPDRVTLTWKAAVLSSKNGHSVQLVGKEVQYKVFALDTERLQAALSNTTRRGRPVVTTLCGLEYYSGLTSGFGGSKNKVVLVESGANSVTLEGLASDTRYSLILAAICSSDCLRKISNSTPTLELECHGDYPCQQQFTLYSPLLLSTPSSESASSSSHHHHSRNASQTVKSTLTVSFVLIGLLVAVFTGTLLYRQNRQMIQSSLSYEMRTQGPSEGNLGGMQGGGGSYGRLLLSEEEAMEERGTGYARLQTPTPGGGDDSPLV